jgi:hypothetical protein
MLPTYMKYTCTDSRSSKRPSRTARSASSTPHRRTSSSRSTNFSYIRPPPNCPSATSQLDRFRVSSEYPASSLVPPHSHPNLPPSLSDAGTASTRRYCQSRAASLEFLFHGHAQGKGVKEKAATSARWTHTSFCMSAVSLSTSKSSSCRRHQTRSQSVNYPATS